MNVSSIQCKSNRTIGYLTS